MFQPGGDSTPLIAAFLVAVAVAIIGGISLAFSGSIQF